MTKIHLGIATSKYEYQIKHPTLKPRGDLVSAVVLENDDFINHCDPVVGLGVGLGIKKYLTKDLIIFTSNQCKTQFALDVALQRVQEKINPATESIDKASILLIDDDEVSCKTARKNGYQSICVGNLAKLSTAHCEAKIGSFFLTIFEKFNLFIPMKMLKAAGVINEENTRNAIEDLCDEMINYMSAMEETGIRTLAESRLEVKKRRRDSQLLTQLGVFHKKVCQRMDNAAVSLTDMRAVNLR
jgi:hypothetical protein